MGALRKPRLVADAEERPPFLGVTASARGLVWRERLHPSQASIATAISQRHDLPELLGRVLAARGVGIDEVGSVLEPTIKGLMPDPSRLRDMDEAARRLADAMERNERIAVFGDYDVDGACSAALLSRFLAHHEVPCRIYIPDRLFEGYGPNTAAIEALAAEGARLILTVDCGTTSFEPLAAAARLGVDVVVVDHHQADERLPEVHALVNPNRQDDLSGLGYLSAAGLVFLLLVATTRELRRRGRYTAARPEPDLLSLLDLVALSTVCDVVPLTGLNRAYVRTGLKVLHRRRNIGLTALMDAAGLDQPPTPYHLGFVLGPRINAGGRIGDAALGARLLAGGNEVEAARIAQLLDKLNRERKAIEARMLEEAAAQAERLVEADPDLPVLVLGSEAWHKGVVGLVASRLTERFGRPSCVIAWQDAVGTASLRSIAGVDIGSAVRAAAAAGHVLKGGGHAMAAGLTVRRDDLPRLEAFFRDELQQAASGARARAGLDIDGAVTAASASPELMQLIERAGPYGQSNPQPRFAFPAHRVKQVRILRDLHVRCILEAADGTRIDAVAFRVAGQPLGELLASAAGMPLHVAGSLRREAWNGRLRTELMIEDAADPRRQG
jgi:single-stranded-DNA-specific exonuclease